MQFPPNTGLLKGTSGSLHRPVALLASLTHLKSRRSDCSVSAWNSVTLLGALPIGTARVIVPSSGSGPSNSKDGRREGGWPCAIEERKTESAGSTSGMPVARECSEFWAMSRCRSASPSVRFRYQMLDQSIIMNSSSEESTAWIGSRLSRSR